MARAELLPPELRHTIGPDDAGIIEAWADRLRGELCQLRVERRHAEDEALAAERRLGSDDDRCPPTIAAAVDVMIDAAAQRLEVEVQEAKHQAMADIAAVVRQCNGILRTRGDRTVVVADAAWRASIASVVPLRPRRAAELWAAGPPAEVRGDADDVLFLDDLREGSGGDVFDGFWADAPERPLALRAFRSGRRRLAEHEPA